jgi:hypothetical protein
MPTRLLHRLGSRPAVLVLIGLFGLLGGPGIAQAQPPTAGQQPIEFQFPNATFSSILTGTFSGQASLTGGYTPTTNTLSRLSGDFDTPLRDFHLRVEPTGTVQASTTQVPGTWFEPPPPGCVPVPPAPFCQPISHQFTASVQSWTVPVEVRFGAYRGLGTLSWQVATCTGGDCPPPNSFSTPQLGQSASLFARVTSAQDAGFLTLTSGGFPPFPGPIPGPVLGSTSP